MAACWEEQAAFYFGGINEETTTTTEDKTEALQEVSCEKKMSTTCQYHDIIAT